ncbi:MAG: carbohydrate binding domain-containing protein [bacterium]
MVSLYIREIVMIKRCVFLILFIPLNLWAQTLLTEKLVIDKELLTPSAKKSTASKVETTTTKQAFTSPYQSLAQGEVSLLKPISKIEEKIGEPEPEVEFEVIIPYQIKLKFDRDHYNKIKRAAEKIAKIERKELAERREKILEEKQKLIEEEEQKMKELEIKIAREEKQKFEEKLQLIEEDIEQELARKRAKQQEEKRIKELAAKKVEEEAKLKREIIEEKEKLELAQKEAEKLAKEKAEREKGEKEEAQRKAIEEKKKSELEKKEPKKLAKKSEKEKRKEERRKKREEELAGQKEFDLNAFLDRELPIDSKLQIDGTKVIDIKAGNSEFLDSKRRKNKEKPGGGFTSGININQELTVLLQGTIKNKINIKVDYSDINQNKKQKFYINYQGDNKEVVQKVEFGDVKFSAPNTEFVNYNQQVFGVSAEAKLGKKTNLWGIASRSKGIRVTKEFKGDRRIVNINRADTSYLAQKYYYLFSQELGTIATPITLEAVYIDDKNGNNNNPPKHIGQATAIIGSKTYTGRFDIQYNGEDYTYNNGDSIITFKQNVGRDYIVGVVFRDNTGKYFPQQYSGDINNPGTILMIEPGVAYVEDDIFEMKNRYTIGEKGIPTDTDLKLEIIDNASKNFFDKNNNNTKDTGEYYYLQIFGLDNNGDGKIDDNPTINQDYIDHETGIIEFPDMTCFDLRGTETNPFLNAHINELKDYLELLSVSYNPNDDYSKQHKYTIIGSYTTKIKTYMLGYLNIVEGSEQIYVDGKLLTPNTDYFIDYDTGFLTFMPHINITENTTIKIDYEYTPFIGTKYQKTIAGLRGEFKLNDNFSIGSTYLYEGAQKLKKIPKVSDPTLGNLQVVDVNASIKVLPLLKNLFKMDNKLPLDITIGGEVAKSFKDKNTFGSAIIDSMEGVEDARTISMDENAWQLGSLLPTNKRAKLLYCKDSYGNLMTAPVYRPITEISGPYDYEENVKWEDDDTVEENVLRLHYTDFGTDSWISIVSPLSNTPIDFTDYTHLEIWFRNSDLNKIDELYIDLGEVSENADGIGGEGRLPKKEDVNNDYVLNQNEDTGWQFQYLDGITTQIGADNNQLDTEDLNGDGLLSVNENYFVLNFKEFGGTVSIKYQIGDWQLWSIPLSKAQIGTGTPRLSAIKHIRLRFKGTQTPTEGEICVGGLGLIGSGRWSMGTVTPHGKGTFTVSSKNAEDDVYSSIRTFAEYKELYPDEDMKREEALVLKYNLEPTTAGTQTPATITKGYSYCTFQTQQGYNDYKYLKFWLYGDSQSEKFFIRFGLNENNYFGYTLPVDFTGWRLISINLDDFKNKLISVIEEEKRKGSNTPPYNYTELPYGYEAKNNPTFDNIKWLSMGVENTSTTQSISGEIYVNEIHLSEAKESNGMARKVAINTKFKDYLSLDWSEKVIDGEFECIGRAPQNDDTTRQDLTLNFTRIKFLPLKYEWFHDISKLDPLVGQNMLNNNCGQTTAKYQKLSTNFKIKELAKKIPKFPDITLNAWGDRKIINTDRRSKKEDETYENLHGDTTYVYNYTFPKKIFRWIPTGEKLGLTSTYKHNEDWSKKEYQVETTKNERILTRSQDERVDLEWTPIKTLTGKSMSNFTQTLKKTQNLAQDDTKYYLTSRKLEQKFDRIVYSGIPFINPRVDSGMIYQESYAGTSTNRRKDINTSAHFGLTSEKELNLFEWFPKLKGWPRYKIFTFTPKFTLDVSANYNNLLAELDLLDCIKNIYNDYYKGQLLKGEGPKTGQYPSFGGERRSASNKRGYELRSNWYTPWKPLEKTSLNYTKTDEKGQNQSSLTWSLTDSYELDMGINLLTAFPKYNKLLGTSSSDRTYFTNKYTWSKTQSNETTIKTQLQPSLIWKRKWKQGLDTEFKLDHQNSKTKKQGGLNDSLFNITPSFLIKHDITRPQPVKLPFGRKLTLNKRLTTDTILKIKLEKKKENNRITVHTNEYSVDMSGTYELQKNVTGTLGGKIGYTQNKLEKDKNFYGYEARFRVNFKF